MTVTVVVGLFVVVMAPGGRQLVEELLQIEHTARLVLEGGQRAGGSGHEHATDAIPKATLLELFANFLCDVHDLRVTSRGQLDATGEDSHVHNEVK